MISILHSTRKLPSHALAISLIIVMTTTLSIISSSPALVQNAFADHGQEIVLSTKDSSFAPISSGEGGSQVKVVVNYVVHDPMVANDLVKGVMKVYSPDGTLLKTSSSPTPFPIRGSHGSSTLATTLTDPRIESVTASIVFTNSIKTETISNELPVNVDLVRGVVSAEQQKEMPRVLSESGSEEEIPLKPLSENKLSSMESAITPTTTEQDEQPAKPEESTLLESKQQVTSIESVPQTITNPSIPPPQATTTKSYITEEICNDGIDNNSDTLIGFSDGKCNSLWPQQQARQERITVATPEICDDDLDNDVDGKVDSRDEECSSTTRSSFPSPRQAQSVTDEQTKEGEDDKEKPSNEDVPEESNEKDEDEDKEQQSDDEDNKDEDDS
ncbi:hypothetical protein BH18THE2_BH18THE2_42770 [soil metagenome]